MLRELIKQIDQWQPQKSTNTIRRSTSCYLQRALQPCRHDLACRVALLVGANDLYITPKRPGQCLSPVTILSYAVS